MRTRLTLFALGVVAAVTVTGASQAGPAAMRLEAARKAAVIDGDVRSAITQLEAIAGDYEKTDRATAALALLRSAELRQKLEQRAEARATYERILARFDDQTGVASMARTALARSPSQAGAKPAVPSLRTVWANPKGGIFGGGAVSRDGRWLPYVDWDSGNLGVRDLIEGRDRLLTDMGRVSSVADQAYAGPSRVSPDSRQIAFGWFNGQRYGLRLVDLASGQKPTPRILYDNPEITYIQPFDWSPDGRLLSVQARRADGSGLIGLLSVPEGILTSLKTFEWRDTSSQLLFSPDGRYLAYDLLPDTDSDEHDVYVIAIDGQRREVTVAPHRKSDHMVAWSRDGGQIYFRSDRSGEVQLWAQPLARYEPQGPPRVLPSGFSGTSLGAADDGSLYDLKATYASSPFRLVGFDFSAGKATSAPVDPGEEYFSINIFAEAAWSADGRSLVLMRRDRGGPVGVMVSIITEGLKSATLVRPKLNSMSPRVLWDGTWLYVSGQDLKDRPGVFRVSAASGEATPIVTGAPGSGQGAALRIFGLSRGTLYYRDNQQPESRLVAIDLPTGVERDIYRASRSDLPRLPTLAPDGQQIAVVRRASGTDTVSLLSIASGAVRDILAKSAADVDLEVLMWAPDSRALFVRRTPPGAAAEILRVDVATGTTVAVPWNLTDAHDVRPHPDGRRLVYTTNGGAAQVEVRVHTNLLSQPPAGR